MDYQSLLNYIHSLGNFSKPAGLERIKSVLDKLGNPQNSFKSIHIAGTNGKGSVSAMLASVFSAAGYKTGLFISPYIVDFRERIQINGEYISRKDLTVYAGRVMRTGAELTEFEFITATAFLYFAEKKIDILICETGLGGRLDATNTLENKIAAVITKIGLDHTAVLGDTYGKIAAEKCGILRNCPAVTTPGQNPEALEVIKESAKNLFIPDQNGIEVIRTDITGSVFKYRGKTYEISLPGEYQIENAVTVIETLEWCGAHIPYGLVNKGLKETFFPGRMEVVSHTPLIVLDGAHNPDGAAVLAKELSKFSGDVTAVIGMMSDKNVEEVLKETLTHCRRAVAVSVPGMSRSMDAKSLAEIAGRFCPCETADTPREAVRYALEVSPEGPVFIFGSLYLVSSVRPMFKKGKG